MPEFFQTAMGQKFYEVTVPRVAKALERIADALEEQNKPHIAVVEAKPSKSPHPWVNDARKAILAEFKPGDERGTNDLISAAFNVHHDRQRHGVSEPSIIEALTELLEERR